MEDFTITPKHTHIYISANTHIHINQQLTTFSTMDYSSNSDVVNHNVEYVAIDIETTGFSFRKDQIFEIACCSNSGRTFHMFIRRVIPLKIQRITHITQAHVNREGRPAHVVWMLLCNWLQSFDKPIVVVGHNILQFDLPFIFQLGQQQQGLRTLRFDKAIDTLQLVRSRKDMFAKASLSNVYRVVCKRELSNAHQADADACANLELFLHPQFQSTFPNALRSGVSFSICVESYFERLVRLNKWSLPARRETSDDENSVSYLYCHVCARVLSKHWLHVHTKTPHSDTPRDISHRQTNSQPHPLCT